MSEPLTDHLKALAAEMRKLADAMNTEAKACDIHSFAPDKERRSYCSGKAIIAKSVADRLDQIAGATPAKACLEQIRVENNFFSRCVLNAGHEGPHDVSAHYVPQEIAGATEPLCQSCGELKTSQRHTAHESDPIGCVFSPAEAGAGPATPQQSKLNKAQAQVAELQAWQDDVTAALNREGRTDYVEVPRLIRELRAQVGEAAPRDPLRALVEKK